MKTKTTTYVAVIMVCMLLFVALIGGISIRTAENILEENAHEKLKLISENGTLTFNSAFDSIEQSVDTLSQAALRHMEDFEKFKSDSNYVDSYTESLEPIMLYTAEHTTGAMSVYIRYNPELAYSTSGIFFVKNEETGAFEHEPPTDFSLYSKDDGERTGWYYDPVNNGAPMWLEPYDNKNIGYRMISYVVPLFIDGEVLGIIGMDIDYDYIKQLADDIESYETGYAFLVNKDGQVIYHPYKEIYYHYSADEDLEGFNEIISGENEIGHYTLKNKGKTAARSSLDAGLVLCITAPDSEIYSDAIRLQYQIIIVATVLVVILAVIATVLLRKIIILESQNNNRAETDG